MKNIFKILLISLVSVLAACCMFACAGGADNNNNNNNSQPVELPGKLEVDAGEYERPINNAYGEDPDIDNVIIDGYLDDELWTSGELKWYTHYEANPRIRYEMAAKTTKEGLCIGFRSYDPIVTWHGYNYFFKNTNVRFDVYTGLVGGKTVSLYFDANNIRPVDFFINGRSQYYGTLNSAGKGDGISVEMYVKWEDLEVDISQGSPDHIDILPLYNYCATPVASSTTVMRPMFVKTTGNTAQAIRFAENGYVDGDEEGAIIGSHDSGMAKTNGWVIEKDENGVETATSTLEATKGFPQVAFFKNTVASSNFKVTTDIKIGKGTIDSRAGIIIYKDSINYRAIALQYNAKNINGEGKINYHNVRGYTNYPVNITMVSDMYYADAEAYDTATLTVYNNGGSLYYVLNGEYIYSEVASYVSTNTYIGIYAFDTTAQFSNYKCELFEDEQALLEDFQQYAYTVSTYNDRPDQVMASIDQIAVNKDGGSVEVTLSFGSGYTLDDIGYIYNGEKEEHSVMDEIDPKSGVFRMNIPGNVSIYTKSKELDESELIDLKMLIVDRDSGEEMYGLTADIIGDGEFTRYNVRFSYGGTTIKVPRGHKWNYVASGTGYKETKGDLFNGEALNESNEEMAIVYIDSLLLGGTALSAFGADGEPLTSFSKISVPGSTWDISNAENGHAIFQTSATDSGEVYFSGRTISDYQVAYVEITNRTDPSAFSSLENDPAAGFLIANENTTTYIGLRTTGLRIIPNRSVFSQRSDVTGITGWNGHIPTVDRTNGGRFISSSIGKGTVNRIPNGETEYTTSYMIIRKGGYTFVYAADGKQNVQKDKTNFDKLTLIYSFYNSVTNGPAAIGFGVTVAFNLRMDFENYWILCGDKAAAFANSEIGTNFTITGSTSVTPSGSGVISYDGETCKGKMVKGANITLTAGEIAQNKILKATASTGEVYYLYNKGESFTHQHNGATSNLKFNFEELDGVLVQGKVTAPDGINRVFYGYLYDSLGNRISSISTRLDGSFSLFVEKGSSLKVAFSFDGYAMSPVDVPEDGNVGTLSFVEIPIGGPVSRVDGATDQSTSNAIYGFSGEDGVYFDYQHNNPGDDGVYIKKSSVTENMVIDFTYERTAKPVSASGSEDSDASVGVVFYGMSGSYGLRFISTGYRIMLNDEYNRSTNVELRGVGPVNMQYTTTPEPYNFRFIKIGSVVYMCCKLESQAKYTVIKAFDLMPHVGSTLTDAEISWCSYGWSKFKFSKIEITNADGKTVADYADELILNNVYVTGEGNVELSGTGIVSYDASAKSGLIVKGSDFNVVAKDVADGSMLKVSVGGVDQYLSNGSAAVFTAETANDTTIAIETISGSTVKGKVEYPSGVSPVRLNGAIRTANGDKHLGIATDYNGNFEVFVDNDNEYYVSFYLDGYVMTPVKIEGTDLGTLTFKSGMLTSTINAMNGEDVAETDHAHNVYENADGSLCIDMTDAAAYDGGINFKHEYVKEDMVISFTYERHAKPSSVSTSEDGDVSFGLVFIGTEGKIGARFIGTGYRIMMNDTYNTASNIEKRGVSSVDISQRSTSDPINFKFVKIGYTVYMFAKYESQDSYKLVYTLNLNGSAYSVGSELTDIQIAWVSHGWYSFTLSNIVVEDVTPDNAGEVYREFTLDAEEGGKVLVDGKQTQNGAVAGYKDAYMNIVIVPDSGKMLSKLIVEGVEVDLSDYNGGEFEYNHKVVSGGPIIVEYKSPVYAVDVEITRQHTNNVKSIVAVSGDKSITFSITADKSKLSESVAYLDTTNKKLTIMLPEGEWTVTLYSDVDASTSIGEYTVVSAI